MKNFFSVNDVTDLDKIVKRAIEIKSKPFNNQGLGKNKTIGHLFFNPSLRTRLSCLKAATNLGTNPWILNAGSDSWQLETQDGVIMNGSSQEHIKEAIQVMSTYCDVLCVRTFPTLKDREADYSETIFKKIIENATVPIVNMESATLHPLQSLADLITITEHKKTEKVKVVLSWAPHPRALPQAVSNSFSEWMTKAKDIDLVIAQPPGFELNEKFTQGATVMHNQKEAFENADFVYAKNWSSYNDYGKIGDFEELKHWTINSESMAVTNQAKFMHCLPVRRNVVVSDDVLDSTDSLVIQQAENRVYSAQTVYSEILEGLIN